MGLDSKQSFKVRKFVSSLKKYRGRHTELVTVYIPAGYDLIKIIQHLMQEQGTASNIKDKTTRLNVQDALERMIRHLKLFKGTPPNGLAAFAGNISEKEGKSDLQVWSIEPPMPLNIRMYRCDQTFVLGPLEDMVVTMDVYGLMVLDNREATIGLLKGKGIQVIRTFTSMVPGKVKVGGWSQQRYARLREEAAHEFYKRIADVANLEFANIPKDVFKGILIGGPGPTKEIFASRDYLHTALKDKIIGIRDITYTDEQGLRELLEKAQDALADSEVAVEKKIVQDFLTMLSKSDEKAIYGPADVLKALDYGAVEKLLISESFPKLEEYEEKANISGTQVYIISLETEEGTQVKELGGVCAILRYNLEL